MTKIIEGVGIVLITILAVIGAVAILERITQNKEIKFNPPIYVHDTLYYTSGTFYYGSRLADRTATGYKIKSDLQHIIALPQNLITKYNPLAPFSYGDTIEVYGDCPYKGEWILQDCMRKDIKDGIDFCVSLGDLHGRWKFIYIKKK